MPDVYFGYKSGQTGWVIPGSGQYVASLGNYYQMATARTALNGRTPCIVTAYASYVRCESNGVGGNTGTVHYVSGPDVDGGQTSNQVSMGTQFTWAWAGGVSAKYATTPGGNQNFYVYDDGGNSIDVGWNKNLASQYYTSIKQSSNDSVQVTTNGAGILFAYHYQQAPSAPQNLRAYSSSGNYGSVDLYWDSPADWGDGDVVGYVIYVNGQQWTSVGNQNSYTIPLTPNQGYTFQIGARNNVTEYFSTYSQLSNTASAAASGVPSSVNNFSAYQDANNAGQINLYWSAPFAGSGASYLNYTIYRDSGQNMGTTSNTSFSVTGLQNWQSYTFYVSPSNQFGSANPSNYSSAISPGVPSAPYNLSATPSATVSGRTTFSWAQPSQTSGGITRYTIYNNGNQVAQVNGNTTSIDVDNYTPGTQYGFDVRPWNQWGDNNGQFGTYSGNVNFTAQGNPTVPKSLTSSSVSTTIGSVTLNWSVPDNLGVGAAQFYNIYVDDAMLTSVAGNVTSTTLNGLSSNTSHNLSVAARNTWNVNNSSVGPRTSNINQTVPGTPSAPQNLNATPSTTIAGLVALTWNVPTTIGGTAGAITHYTIYRTDSNGNAYPDSPHDTKSDTSPTATSYNWTTTPKTASNFYVVAWNDAADASTTPKQSSPQSNTASVTSNGAAVAPTGLTLTPGTASIGRLVLTWNPPSGTIVNYTVTRNDGVQKVLNATKYVDDTVVPGTLYSYSVQATNTTGVIGASSDSISGTANTTSTQPVANLTAVNQTNTDLSGTYSINSTPTGSSFTYRQTTPALAQTAVPTGAGTLVDNTNVFLNGTYFGNVYNTTQVNIAKSGTPFSTTQVPNGTLTDNTNVALSGNQKVVTAINVANKAFSYAATYADTTQRSAAGTVVDTTNEIFNNGGNSVTLSATTDNTFSYPLTASNVAETTATGTATDVTNRDYFNGHYTVSAVPSPTSIQYQKVAPNLRASLTNLVVNPRMETAGVTYIYHTNLCTNPSFETNTTSWTPGSAVTAVKSTSFAYVGTSSLLVTKSALADANSSISYTLTGMTVGNTYTISGYFLAGNGNAQPYFSVTGKSSSNPITLTSSWQRTSYSFVATATSHVFNIQAGAATVATSNFYVDAIFIQDSPLVNTYFDGTSTATADFTFAWTGTAHASTSTQTATTVSGTTQQSDGTSGKNWAKNYRTTSWAADGTRSLVMVNRGTHDDQWINIASMVTLAANKTYTFAATIKTVNSVTNPQQIRLQAQNSSGTPSSVYSNIVGTPGVYTFVGTFNTTGYAAGDYLRLYNQINNPGATLYWDSIMIFEGTDTTVPMFSGASTSTSMTKYAWTGTADNSTSTRVTDLSSYSGAISLPYGGVARSDNPAAMDIFYRSGWLG